MGDDGPTHHGVFDVGVLSQVPGMLILNPASLKEQQDMLRWAAEVYDGPVAVRYPRGGEGSYRDSAWNPGKNVEQEGAMVCHRTGSDITLITYGSLLGNVLEAAELLQKQGISAAVLRLQTLSSLPASRIAEYLGSSQKVLVIEETCAGSGVHHRLGSMLRKLCPGCQVEGLDLGPDYIPHGQINKLYEYCGLDSPAIAAAAKELLKP